MAKTGLLDEYARKRTFGKTPEPPASADAAREGPLLFVIQQHAATRLHFDLRLECDGVLKSWAVPKGLSLDPADKRLAMQTEDHPYAYASFEGIIPAKQYGAGEVIVWDCGPYSPDEPRTWFGERERGQDIVREGLAKGKLSFQLRGEKLKGSFALVKTKGEGQWLVIKHKDRFVRKAADAQDAEENRSILSGASVEEIKKVPARRIDASRLIPCGPAAAMPKKLAPMLAEIGEAPFNREGWMWEPKLDGYRALAFVGAEGAVLRSRNGLDLSAQFPRLAQELAKQGEGGMILDGEIVVLDGAGRPSFNALQNRAQLKSAHDIAAAEAANPAVFFAFDILHFAGVDLRGASYAERRRYLSQCVLPSGLVQLVHASTDGVALHEAALASGFEGVVGKRKDSRYESGKRSASWTKVKPTTSADFVIGGFTKGKGARAPLGSILVGHWDKGTLRYASHVGSGFDDRTLAALKERLEPLARKSCPFEETPELNGPTTWTEPKVVAEVRFHSWTEDERLRAPVFMRLRDDVDAKSIRRPRLGGDAATRAERNAPLRPLDSRLRGNDMVAGDEIVAQLDAARRDFTLVVEGHRIKVTNLDRVYWPADPSLGQPALTKRDLLRYFALVSPYILPHLADRPLTMIRMPSGIRGQRFFQKHWEQEKPAFVETITVFSGHKDEEHDYLLCNNLPTLLWLAQSGTLEFHVWHSRARPAADCASKATDYASSLEALEASVLNYPDWVVFDIDPYIYSGKEAPGAEPELNTAAFEKGKEVAFRLREVLQTMGLDAIVKTSGKTGLHIFVPIRRTLDFDAARHVSELVGRHLVGKFPDEITVEWSIPKRTGKIFMDYNMNVRGKTLNVAYSPRGEAGAPVSMPLTWDELASAHPLDFRLANAPQRLARTGDRWRDAYEAKQDLERALRRSQGK